jgi:DedD protein
MEKKTTQRIIGILVAVTLVVILLPLLIGKNDITAQTASIKAPPFPDQSEQLASAASSDVVITQDMADRINHGATAPIPAAPKPVLASAAPVAAATHAALTEKLAPKPAVPAAEQPLAATESETLASAASDQAVEKENIKTVTKPIAIQKVAHKTETHKHKQKQKNTVKAAAKNSSATAWVVQLGSFKNKSNAKQLAEKLRHAGYKVFTHDVKSHQGSVQTRVYLGPEYQHAAAAKLSAKFEQKMSMRGFVVAYKPIES